MRLPQRLSRLCPAYCLRCSPPRRPYVQPAFTAFRVSPCSFANASPLHTIADAASQLPQLVYVPEADVENFEDYTPGGFHPVAIGNAFQEGRYEVVHKLGFGGYSKIWLARDTRLQRYVALKILVAIESSKSTETAILRQLSTSSDDSKHSGQQFMPRLLDEFSFQAPNGSHKCLVQEPAGCSIASSKDMSLNFMFPVESARSIVAQLAMGLSYLHGRGICHGDLHLRNLLLHNPGYEDVSLGELYKLHPLYKAPITRIDGASVEPHAAPYAVFPMDTQVAADKPLDPLVKICDYGTSFVPATEPNPQLHTPPLFLPPGDLFQESITLAADIWTLGLSLYEILGERSLFESFSNDRDDILADIISTLGQPPARWWNKWENRREFFERDGSWTAGI